MIRKRKKLLVLGTALALSLCSCGNAIGTKEDISIPEVTAADSSREESSSETISEAEPISSEESSTVSSQTESQPQPLTKAEQALAKLSLREKVGQLFILRYDGIMYNDNLDHDVQSVDEQLINCIEKYPVGGFIILGANIAGAEQITELNHGVSELYGTSKPFLCIDEEGGSVARIANSGVIDVPQFPSNSTIAAGGDTDKAYELGKTIGGYLKEYGFNLDLAPVADVNTNPQNIVIGSRAFGSDPEAASEYVSAVVDGLHESGIMSCLKHFPGHGDTAEDSHFSTAVVNKTWEEMKQCELIPFIGSLDKTDMVMTAHITAPKVTDDDIPASLSHIILTDKLRNELGYEGVIITDSLGMGAVSKYYSPEECCIKAIEAGVDILLKPAKAYEAFEAVYKAAEDGSISEERLNESVLRILRLKEKYGLLDI